MKVMAINGSPRKKWNTATLLDKALEGAASQGAETELIHLYDLNYKGCISCFALSESINLRYILSKHKCNQRFRLRQGSAKPGFLYLQIKRR